MHNQFDVLIIGSGIFGAGILYYLATTTNLKIALLEQNYGNYSATGASGGLIRTLHLEPFLTELAYQNLIAYQNFASEIGSSCGFKSTGFYTILNQIQLAQYDASITMLLSKNIDIYLWSPKEIKNYQPDLNFNLSQDEVALVEPGSGYAEPMLARNAYLNTAKKHSAVVHEKISVEKILFNRSKVTGAKTSAGIINADCVVIATGAWTTQLFRQSEITVPDICSRSIQVNYYHQPTTKIIPPFLDKSLGLYGRMTDSQHYLLGLLQTAAVEDPKQDNFLDIKITETLAERATSRLIHWKNHHYRGGRRSYDAYSLTHQGLNQFHQDYAGLFICSGWSGVGFKFAPIASQTAAKKIAEYFSTKVS